MRATDERGIAWVWADTNLDCEAAQAAAAKMVAEISGMAPEDVRACWAQAQGAPWAIQNAYYEADVLHYFCEVAEPAPANPAVVLLVHRGSPLTMHAHRAQVQSGFDVPMALVVGVEGPTIETPRPDMNEVDETYAVHGWEYIDATDADATARVRDALMVHRWPGATVRDTLLTEPPGVLALAQLPDVDGPWPAAPASMQDDLEAFLAEDDEFGAFVGDDSARHEPHTGVDTSLASLTMQIQNVQSLPPGSAKRDAAARIALSVERALSSS
ncbi:hypothetical protein MNAN1_003191 [Malassezia nana]|uniref:Uncharacterized protein n=1 Tax=Malassezia nana TaxID=180528 RepID=A0AAF0ELE5_9BASI|nr:hypothetical protein MNAN1_003191 [Malassezia nana]